MYKIAYATKLIINKANFLNKTRYKLNIFYKDKLRLNSFINISIYQKNACKYI